MLVEAAEMEIQALADLKAHPQRPQDRIDQEEAEQYSAGATKNQPLICALRSALRMPLVLPHPAVRRARGLRRLRETLWPTADQPRTAAPTRGAGRGP